MLFYVICVLLLALGIIFDNRVELFLAGNGAMILTDVMNFFSFVGEGLLIFAITTLIFLIARKGKKLPFLWASFIISYAITAVLKIIVMRHRPDVALYVDNSFSFPSGHATAVFSVLALIWKELPWLKWFWLVFAVLVTFSRLYLGMHFLTDVIVGAIIGFTVGLMIVKYEKNIIGMFKRIIKRK